MLLDTAAFPSNRSSLYGRYPKPRILFVSRIWLFSFNDLLFLGSNIFDLRLVSVLPTSSKPLGGLETATSLGLLTRYHQLLLPSQIRKRRKLLLGFGSDRQDLGVQLISDYGA
jgi:hypothetical protein